VDIAIGGLTITEPRAKAVDFSYPYFETSVGYLANVPRETSKAMALLGPYHFSVWVPLVVFLIISGPLLWMIARKSKISNFKRKLSISRSYSISFQIVMAQGKNEMNSIEIKRNGLIFQTSFFRNSSAVHRIPLPQELASKKKKGFTLNIP
jgi:ABC-type amino acid transport substrate-binding protein